MDNETAFSSRQLHFSTVSSFSRHFPARAPPRGPTDVMTSSSGASCCNFRFTGNETPDRERLMSDCVLEPTIELCHRRLKEVVNRVKCDLDRNGKIEKK